jgi:RNA polymerase sigma-70 factor (ECF subfamily)
MPESVEPLAGKDGRRAERPAVLGSDVDATFVPNLVRQLQAGDHLAENYEKLFRRFRPLVHAFFIRKGFPSEESRDLTQEVFLRVFKGIDTFRGESRFERWLWEIADNIYLNELRRRKTEKRNAIEQSLDARPVSDSESSQALQIPAPDLSPEELVLQRQSLKDLRAAFQDLPAQMRRCCILRYEKGLKYQEIAVVMKISIETVKAHLHQARKRLTARLGETPGSTRGEP